MWICDSQLCGRLYDAELEQCPFCEFSRRHWEPTREEIAAACERIRRAWSEAEEYRRQHGHAYAPLEIELFVRPGGRRVDRRTYDD